MKDPSPVVPKQSRAQKLLFWSSFAIAMAGPILQMLALQQASGQLPVGLAVPPPVLPGGDTSVNVATP